MYKVRHREKIREKIKAADSSILSDFNKLLSLTTRITHCLYKLCDKTCNKFKIAVSSIKISVKRKLASVNDEKHKSH